MPQTVRRPSRGAKYAIYYLTVGALIMIWSAVWFYYLMHHEYPAGDGRYYLCTGLMLSGAAVFLIGSAIGWIGRETKQADVPVATVATPATAPAADQVDGVRQGPVAPPAASGAQRPQTAGPAQQPAVPVGR